MPGFAIHLAVAYEYLRKNSNDIINKKEFINGVVAPDLVKDKYESHYGNYGTSHIGLNTAIYSMNANTDFDKGYLLHLITDEDFYHNYFINETKYIYENNTNFYNDYDCTNKYIIKYFENEYIPSEALNLMKIKDENPKILKIDKIIEFIDKLSSIKLEEQINSIKEKNEIII